MATDGLSCTVHSSSRPMAHERNDQTIRRFDGPTNVCITLYITEEPVLFEYYTKQAEVVPIPDE